MANLTNDILTYEDPGKMDDELFRVPGLVNELTNLTLANAPRPNKPLAFMGALACVSHLAGRTYEDEHGTHANLYLVSLAPTAMGKDEPRLTNQRLAAAIGASESVPEDIASPQGLEDALKISPALLLQNDEADALFGAMSSNGLRAAKLNATVLRLYSQSKGVLMPRRKAGEGHPTLIEKPHLTLFATGIPDFVYRSLSPKSLMDGLMGRCLFLETNAFCRLGNPANAPLPEDVVRAAQWMYAREEAFAKSGTYDPIVVRTTDEAKALIDEMKAKCDDIAEEALRRDRPVASALMCRFSEKATKLAMVGAISANPYKPEITAEAVTWAANFVAYATKQMLARSAFYVNEGSFGKIKAHAFSILEKHGGRIDRTTLLRNLNIPVTTFKVLISTLLASEMIESEIVEYGKVMYSLQNSKGTRD